MKKILSLILGIFTPVLIFWLLGILVYLKFLLGGSQGASMSLMGSISIGISFLASYYLAQKRNLGLHLAYLLMGNILTLISWSLMFLLSSV